MSPRTNLRRTRIQALPAGVAATLLLAALQVASPTPAPAQTIGRVEVTVIDDTGKPVVGAEILVTSEELTRFKQNVRTDKRGKVAVSFVDATKVYLFHVEAEGYQSAEQFVKPQPQQTTRQEIVLVPKGQARTTLPEGAQAGAPPPSYTPAQLAFNTGVEELRASAADPAQAKTKLASAVAKFEEALDQDPNLKEAWSALAVAQAELEDWEAAIDAAERFAEANDGAGNASTYRVLYRAHQALGHAGEAQQARDALSALGEGKDSAAFAHNEGVAAVRIGDDDTALERFQEALRLDPTLAPAALGVTVLHLRHSRFAEAAAAAEHTLTLDPENMTALMARWQSYRALGDKEKEKVALDELAKRDPAPLVADLLDRGKTLFESGDSKAAIVELARAVELAPDDAEAHYRLGLCYVGLDDQPAAKRHLDRFLALAPDHPEAATAREMLAYLK